ncbi:MAG: VWA domain-containing protein [Burkholderiales bacterium]|nr:VWA domain-containing protein [Phycisphaerae bacterium]
MLRPRSRLLTGNLACAVLALSICSNARAVEQDLKPDGPVVQVALLLDTSNSMDGLINQARTQLWKIVNEFNKSKYAGQQPKLQVALYEYGNNGLAAGEGYIRMVLPLTTDLDLVSEKLWGLKTNGGSEYCGQAIHNAATELAWSRNAHAYKAIFIAGNEPFTQGSVDFRASCSEALSKGVIINTIHCGPEGSGREGGWADGAKAGEGKFLNIDQDRASVVFAAPQDDELLKLSITINGTYVPYGKSGDEGKARQSVQTANASTASAGAERAYSSANATYTNGNWDLVDAVKEKKIDLATAKDSDLPEVMRKMTVEERQKYIDQQAAQRAEIQKRIAELYAARDKFVLEERQKQSSSEPETLDTAILKAVREQLNDRDFKTE